jgi:tetratricopeptide (TPR) repeat protein
LFIYFLAPIALALNADSLFSAANNLYNGRDFTGARELYQRLEQYNYISAPLHFNIGNCYFKENKPGYAVLYYLRAQKLAPNDEDIRNNLDFIRQFMPTNLEGVKINPVNTFFDRITAPFTLNGLGWISSILFILLFLFLSAMVHFWFRGLMAKIVSFSLLVLLLVFSGMTTFKYRTDYLTKWGVIVANEANIYSGPGEDNDLEFVAAYGLTFEIEKTSDKYYLAIFENKRKGWIKKELVEVI